MEEQIRKLAKDFAENELKKKWEELDCKNSDLLKDILKKSAEIGVFSFLIDEKLGGGGFGAKDFCVFLEEIAKGCGGVGLIYLSHLMGITPILLLNDKEKRDKFLSIITESEKKDSPSIFTLAIKEEKFSKLIPDNIQTMVKVKDKNYILSGNKINILCAEIADYFTLLAKLENSDKFVLLIVPSNLKGIEIKEEKQKMGLKICPINDVFFNDVEISEENILSENIKLSELLNYYKFFDSSLGAVALGMAEEGYNIALKYAKERYQGGKIICEHDVIKIMLSEMKLSIEVARNFVYNSSDLPVPACVTVDRLRQTGNFISSVYASEIAEKVCIDAIQILGGYGYMKDFKLERILRDVKTLQGIINSVSRKMEYIEDEIEKIK